MTAEPAPGREYFTAPRHPGQRRYEAPRAYFTEDLTVAEAGARAGYTRASMASLLRDFRAGRLQLFAPPGKPGPKTAPAKDRARARVLELRRQGLSVHEISARLRAEGTPLNRTGVGQILAEEGFGRLLRGTAPEASTSPATPGRDTHLPRAAVIDFAAFPDRAETSMAGLLLAVLPKKSALTSYSYRLSHDHQQKLLAALDKKMISAGLATAHEAIFDLDFHAVMHWGQDPVLEKHYVPSRSPPAGSPTTTSSGYWPPSASR